jgi:hypothetical protein
MGMIGKRLGDQLSSCGVSRQGSLSLELEGGLTKGKLRDSQVASLIKVKKSL